MIDTEEIRSQGQFRPPPSQELIEWPQEADADEPPPTLRIPYSR